MKLIYRITLRLASALLPLMALWTWGFYTALADEINDDMDNALEDYAETIVLRHLAGMPLPGPDEATNNSYTITPVSKAYARTHSGLRYFDADMYITEKRDSEPARLRTSIFQDADGLFYELTVSLPTFEKDEMIGTIAWWIVSLYAVLLATVLGIAAWIFRSSLRPLYALLEWLDGYTLGVRNRAVPNDTAVTEFSQLNAAVEQAMNRSQALFEQQREFIGNASHELQTPLAVLAGRMEWLLDNTDLGEEATGQVVSMQRMLAHTVRLNKTLLMLTKIDNNQFTENSPVDIAGLCRRQVEHCGEIFAERGIRTKLRLPERFIVPMNESLAEILVSNLVRNAYIHTCGGADIDIYTEAKTWVVVNDGEAPLDGERIFERFYQGSKREGSTGLGLALVKAVCRSYGFGLSYRFDRGRHCFCVEFPAVSENL